MSTTHSQFLEQWAQVRETSLEIAEAIFELASGDDDAERIWSDPSTSEISAVEALAWALADDDCTALNWGCTRILGQYA